MRHRKNTFKIGRTASHRRCLIANMLKALVCNGTVETTVAKGKELRRQADKLITLAKKNTLASRRQAISALMVTFNGLSHQKAKESKAGDHTAYNDDRLVVQKLFNELGPRFAQRQGGYTRLVRSHIRQGDNAPVCVVSYLTE